jgi:hypothetical protein
MAIYFAKDDVEKLIDKCQEKLNSWGASAGSYGFFSSTVKSIWRNNAMYYSSMLEPQAWDTSMMFEGDKGEFVKALVPKARTLIRQYVSLATKQRYSFDCVTDVADSNPMNTARLGAAIVKSESEKHKVDILSERIVETCSIEGWCFVTNTWNTGKGKIWGRADDQGNMLYSGGTDLELFTLQDVAFDWTAKSPEDLDWMIFRRKMNRWNLIAQFPEIEEQIKSLPAAFDERLSMPTLAMETGERNDDLVFVKEFYHKPTPALPFGRMVVYCNQDVVLFDGENPYECIPGVMFLFQPIKNTLLGYPMMSSLVAAQELMTSEISTVASNHSAFGVQSVLVPKGSNISVNQIAKGMTFIDYTPQNADGGGKPEPLQLTATPPEIFNFLDRMSSTLEEMSMINSTLRGQPPANVTSGAMAATLSANALEFIYSDTKGLTIGLEQLMGLSIKNYQKFATVEQVIDVVGEGNTSSAQQFQADQLKGIKQIKIRQGNPLLNTIAGRLQLGESILPLLQAGKTDAVSRYLGLLEGAPIETLFDSELSENAAVTMEIEALQRGENVAPLITDNHPMFIRAYQRLLYNPAVRQNGQLVQTLLALMQERATLEMQCPPDLKAILRNQPMMMPQQMGPAPQQTNAPSEAAAQAPVTQPSEAALPAQAQV